MTNYLTASEILQINAAFIGPDQLRDFGLLDSAIARPQSTAFGEDAFPSIHEKAAALFHGIARNHAFIDANKRTALSATVVFYKINGYIIRADEGDLVALAVDIAEGQLDIAAIAGQLKSMVHSIPADFDPFA